MIPAVEYDLPVQDRNVWSVSHHGELTGSNCFHSKEEADRFYQNLQVDGNCHICGGFIAAICYLNPTKQSLIERKLCFSCLHWVEIKECERADIDLVIDGCHYMLGAESAPHGIGMRGFGGRKFTIIYLKDGREITTTNLWTQGIIPKRFLAAFPNNAKFKSR